MAIISRGKNDRNPPLGIPRDEIFTFEEKEKKIDLKGHRKLYRGLQYYNDGQIIRASYGYEPAMRDSEMDTYFDPNNDAVMSSLLCVLPALLVS